MSSEKSLTPQIRFKGFTEAWEQRKAIDLFKDVSEKGFDNLPVLSATQDRGMVYRDENGINISHDKKNELTYKHVIPGQFVIHLRSFQGGFAHSAIEGITSPAYTVFKFINESQHDDIFWKYIFMSERFIKSLETVTYGIRDGRSISYSEFLALPFAVPEKEEENRIGHFLKKYDSLITLHQRKLDALKKIKSALLEKMFPKDGSNIPEIRFTGFTEAWEQRKLSDIATKQTSKNTNSIIREPFTNSAEQGVVSQYDYFDHGITNVANISNYFVINPNDFVYNPRISVTAPCGPINRNRLNRPGIMSPLYTIFRTNQCIDVTYLEYYFKTKKWHPFMFLEGNTGARSDRFSISDSMFFKLPIQIPSKAEQKLISKQLEALSNLITLHQRKLDALKKIKSALLEKMFV